MVAFAGCFRYDDPEDDIRYEAGQAAGEQEDYGNDADNDWVDIEVLGQAATDAGDHAVGAGTVKSFGLGIHMFNPQVLRVCTF